MVPPIVEAVPEARDAESELNAGREAMSRARWDEAREHFEASLALEETPEALEHLGFLLGWRGDIRAGLARREAAFRLYRERGDCSAAARVAIWLALEYAGPLSEPAVGNGWMARARRLLEGHDPVPEHAWLHFWEGHLAFLYQDDHVTGRRLLAEAVELARSIGSTEVELIAGGLEGLALVAEGCIREGMRRLDEAVTAALSGELRDLEVAGQACCYVMRACEQVQDFDRAAQWLTRVKDHYGRMGHQRSLSFCRSHHAAILTWRGAWEEAEAELEAVFEELAEIAPSVLPEAAARLGDLRRRQGRLDEAAAHFARAESTSLAALGRAALALDRGEPEAAVDLVDRYFRLLPPEDRVQRMDGYSLLVRAHVALDRPESAAAALAELRAVAEAVGTEAALAALRAGEGLLARAAGDAETARHRFEEAIHLFERAGSPFESGVCRNDLTGVLLSLGRRAAAAEEAGIALAALERIGAAHEAARSAALLAEAGMAPAGGETAAAGDGTGLSQRQTEVLGLLAQGLTNREIGERLFVSEFTVKRHVADILTKLDLPSRAAAAAWAVSRGIA